MEIPDKNKQKNKEKKKKSTQQFQNLRIPLLILFTSFLLSHPLLFLKLISFLCPLLLTTLLILLFTSHRPNAELEQSPHDEGEVYKIFFEAPSSSEIGSREPDELVDKFLISGDSEKRDLFDEETENEKIVDGKAQGEKTLEELFHEKGGEDGCGAMEVKDVVKEEEVKDVVKEHDVGSQTGECGSRAWRNSRRLSSSMRVFEKTSAGLGEDKAGSVLGGFGSMRRMDKEWKRNLACKLFEERHNSGPENAEEGMDLLWEAYEKTDSPPGPTRKPEQVSKKSSTTTKKDEEIDDDDDDEDDGMGRDVCCLQALKLSAGKVNLGMGRPNIAKISKAFRGIGWLHHVRSRKVSPLKNV